MAEFWRCLFCDGSVVNVLGEEEGFVTPLCLSRHRSVSVWLLEFDCRVLNVNYVAVLPLEYAEDFF